MATERQALLIAPTLPARTGNGLAIRLGVFTEALSRVCRTQVVCIPLFGPPADEGWLASLGASVSLIDPAGREDTHFRLLARLADPAARLAAFRRYGKTSLAARLSTPVLAELRSTTGDRPYDLVHVGRSYMMEAALAVASASHRTVDLDEDDAWSWRSLAAIATTPEAADWARAEADATDDLLPRLLPRFDASFISSPVEGRRLVRRLNIASSAVVANPAPPSINGERADDAHSILFVGSYGYAPNLDGLDWFLADIWPRIRQRRSDLRFKIVGRDLPARFLAVDGSDGIEAIGPVDSLEPFYRSAALVVAPLRAGGGTRIKLIEAAAFGVPIVATSVAARGLAFNSTRYIWRADTAVDFSDAVLAAMGDPAERTRRAERARQSARHHDRAQLVERLACRFAELLAT